jgi:hypothetical protein
LDFFALLFDEAHNPKVVSHVWSTPVSSFPLSSRNDRRSIRPAPECLLVVVAGEANRIPTAAFPGGLHRKHLAAIARDQFRGEMIESIRKD